MWSSSRKCFQNAWKLLPSLRGKEYRTRGTRLSLALTFKKICSYKENVENSIAIIEKAIICRVFQKKCN